MDILKKNKYRLNDEQLTQLKKDIEDKIRIAVRREVENYFWGLSATREGHPVFQSKDNIKDAIISFFAEIAQEHYKDNMKRSVDDYLGSEEFIDWVIDRINRKQIK